MKLLELDMDDYTALVKAAREEGRPFKIYPFCAFGFYFLPDPNDPPFTSDNDKSASDLLALGFDPRFVITAFVLADAGPTEIGEISQISPHAGE